MDFFGILTMVGGLALFLYGMNTMGDGLVMLSGGKLEQVLERLTKKRIMALLLGALVTAVIQSSSATTVMVVGFVNSGIMNLTQAVGMMTGKDGSRKKTIGSILLGFAVLMFGMETMSGAVSPLKDNPTFTGMLTAFSNPVLGMAAGAVLTAIILL